jgi:hypothetical protein
MADSLLAAGRWLKYAGDCVYATVRIARVCDETRVLKNVTGLLVPNVAGPLRVVPISDDTRNVLYRRIQQTHQRLGCRWRGWRRASYSEGRHYHIAWADQRDDDSWAGPGVEH